MKTLTSLGEDEAIGSRAPTQGEREGKAAGDRNFARLLCGGGLSKVDD